MLSADASCVTPHRGDWYFGYCHPKPADRHVVDLCRLLSPLRLCPRSATNGHIASRYYTEFALARRRHACECPRLSCNASQYRLAERAPSIGRADAPRTLCAHYNPMAPAELRRHLYLLLADTGYRARIHDDRLPAGRVRRRSRFASPGAIKRPGVPDMHGTHPFHCLDSGKSV